ncbi:hypothetical protein DL96DRAFT_1571671 [Flagelloscypha sp. PMI_526]|nr:hypothetical protein DL96DRAFT_1571671 [Flagelloscypha sp. PMI_526]
MVCLQAHRVPVLESSEDEYEVLPSTSTSRKNPLAVKDHLGISAVPQKIISQPHSRRMLVIPYKPSSSLSQLLQTLPANSLENESTPNCIVSRQDLVKKYHIPNTGLICNKGAHRFVLPTRNLNPHIPNTVGAPGLFFGARMELTEGVWHCFIPRKVDKQTKQEYIGDYEFEYIATLDSDDFQGFSTKEKQDWGHNILAKRMIPLYCAMRARIGLRLSTGSQSNPTNKEIETQLRRLHNRTKAGSPIEVTTDDIIAALENGN